jgi:NADH-quinone oxidoreductase subunit I
MIKGIFAIIRGMGITFKHMLMNIATNRFTVQYPKQKRVLPDRARWALSLQWHEDLTERCVGCQLCAAICPSEAIYIEGAVNPLDKPIGKGERYAMTWIWDATRCLYCGFCVEACPEEAIVMTKIYELATDRREDLIWYKARLYEAKREQFGEKPTSAWMGFYRRAKDMGKPIELARIWHEQEEEYYKDSKKFNMSDRYKRFLREL